ncbi:MAG: BACON domain-containing protein [Fibromonadaceae bacterium]|jgi:hypothetical protein|nr:BACON domain-containing protein [Fibromonadaceae bacterium]
MRYLLLFLFLILCSCERYERYECELPGCVDCYPEELPHLFFDPQGGIDSAYIGHYNWWFPEPQYPNPYNEEKCKLIESEKIECPWFSMEKRDGFVVVSVKQNDTKQKRYKDINVNVNHGGTGPCNENRGWVTISQCFDSTDIELSKEKFLFSAEGGADSVIITTNRESWLSRLDISIWYENAVYGYNFYEEYIKWFNIDIIDEKKIVFSVNRNETGKERSFSIEIDSSNCGTSIKVVQSAE